ncbi:biogenesis of lysosome-related organelles complex 1 subunit 6-like [Dendronephthya gigantea]|uniref:biogenesis of lysosome-related organelles complex 1 subunit 6-like n=1 Tax=Dendronephthya gigantea TaxID=151771 RepID=UPI00106C0461|nr:biogenesis of lysosome-related organelles complex 1 subunit 6-like [Dendronephthya gigantea]XP_028402523.1 biogenesis of lysosome-related organelles complex 1 subunit 6-like [Dendronephthya gigantea]
MEVDQQEINEKTANATVDTDAGTSQVCSKGETSNSYSGILTENVEDVVQHLTDGFLTEVEPQLLELREKTKEITKNQSILIETIEQENRKYSENKDIEELTKVIAVVQSYYTKLRKIKNDMDHLDDKLGKLKKRSLKLKEKRQKKDQDEAQRRERELVLERELTAKVKPAT